MAGRSCIASFNIYCPLKWHVSLSVEPVGSGGQSSPYNCLLHALLPSWKYKLKYLCCICWESRRQKMSAANSGWKEFVTSFSNVDLHLRNFDSLNIYSPEIYAPISTVAVSITDVPLWYPQVYWHDYIWIKTFPHYVGIPSQSWWSSYLQKSAFDSSAFMRSWVLCNSVFTKIFASGKYH